MFKSTTIRLTGWYLLILMSLSIAFSIFVYQVANNELHSRLERLQTSMQVVNDADIPNIEMSQLRIKEQDVASSNLSNTLLYVNMLVLGFGGLISYFLARRNLLPIQKAHEEQSRFTSDASHELRTPLAIMKTELEVALGDKQATAKDLRNTLISNLEEVDKLSKLSEMLLSLSRLDSAGLKLKPTNLNQLVSSAIKSFGQPSSRLKFSHKGQLTIKGNDTAITDLVRVLVNNALQYSPTDSLVKVNLTRKDGSAVFEIKNAGTGIDSDKLPHIFERFYRADSSRTTGEQKGYGIGLALAKNIVEIHDGNLTVSSAKNSETIFTFLIPLHEPRKIK